MSEYKQNLHTHTTFCDGADTPEQMVLAAIEKDFDSIGFSGHSTLPYSEISTVTLESTALYKKEIARLKKKYEGVIEIFCGLEFDMYSDDDLSGLDYVIGSVHYIDCGDSICPMDRNLDMVKKLIDEKFGGSGIEYAKKFYSELSRLPEYGRFDIIAHFDLLAKHSENEALFDEDSREYRDAAISAAEALAGKIPFFEVNTGAISRGYRTTPYPSPFILKELKRLGFGAIISSDCHNKNYLDCHFEESRELLRSCGFRELYFLGKDGFFPTKL